MLGDLEAHLDGPVRLSPEGVQRVRNAFLAVSIVLGVLVLVVLAGGNTDAAIGMTMALLGPSVIFSVIAQLILWFAEASR